MPQNLVSNFELNIVGTKDLVLAADAAERLADAEERLAKSLVRVKSASRGIARGGSSGSGIAANGGGGYAKTLLLPPDSNATGQYNVSDMRRASRIPPMPKSAKEPPSLGKRIGTALMTSRVGIGANGLPQLMPIVGRLAAVFGTAATAVFGLATATLAGASAIEQMSRAAGDDARERQRTSAFLGGNAQGAARLELNSRFLGTDALGLSQSLRQNTGGYGAIGNTMLGLQPFYNPMIPTDPAADFETAARRVRKMKRSGDNAGLQRLLQIKPEASGLLPYGDLSDDTFEKAMTKRREELSPAGAEKLAEQSFKRAEMEQSLADLQNKTALVFADAVNLFYDVSKGLAERFGGAAGGFEYDGNIEAGLKKDYEAKYGKIPDLKAPPILLPPGESAAPTKKDLQANTKAMNDNSAHLALLNKNLNLGERGGSAVPSELTGMALRQALDRNSLRLVQS